MYFFLFTEYDCWDLSTSLVLVEKFSPCSTANKRFSLKYGAIKPIEGLIFNTQVLNSSSFWTSGAKNPAEAIIVIDS